MGHDAFVDGYKKPSFRLHIIILLTIVGVSIFLSTQVEKSKEKTRIEALKIPVPIDSVFVDENANAEKPEIQSPKIADASSVIKEPDVEYRFESGPNLAAIDAMLSGTNEPVSDVSGALSVGGESAIESETAPENTGNSSEQAIMVVENSEQPEKDQDVAIMVTDDVIPEPAQEQKENDSVSAGNTEDSELSTNSKKATTTAKLDAVYELQQNRFLETLAKSASQKTQETVEVKRIKDAIRSDKPLKLKSTVKNNPVAQQGNEIVKVAATSTTGVLEKDSKPGAASKPEKVVVAKSSDITHVPVTASVTDAVKQISLTKGELNNVLKQFARSYNKGDIIRLMALFDDNAVTNDQNNKLGIKAEYDELFKTTSNRHIKIRNIQWNLNNDKATGDAKFTVTVQPSGNAEPAQIEGKIEILAVKEDRGVFIKRLLHQVTR